MERQKKVVDASVAAKWFLNEEDTKRALLIRDAHIKEETLIIVPDLLFLEVLNALKYKNSDKELLEKVNKILWDIQLHIERTNEFILEKAVQISIDYNLTIYDALYAAIAQMYGCPLITTDEKRKKFPSAIAL